MSENRDQSSRDSVPATPRVLVWLGQAWLIVGITIALFLVLEFGYRGQAALRGAWRGDRVAGLDSTLHPYASRTWWAEYQAEDGARQWRLDPYRGFWPLPQQGRYINIDAAGYRLTPQPVPSAPPRKIRFFGGSAMWGIAARDSFTIPALVAQRLREKGITDVVVENRAQPGFTITQNMATLSLDLARRDVPDVAVFLDGFNETMTARAFGAPGHTYTEAYAQRLLDRGRRGGWEQVAGLGEYSALVRRLREVVTPDSGRRRERPDPDAICGPVARYYRGVADVVMELGDAYRFTPLFLQQAVHASSDKRLTAWEVQLPERPTVRRCAEAMDSAMADRAGRTYLSLVHLFDADTNSVFVDAESHVTEEANARIAGVIADRLVAVLPPSR